MYEDMYLGRDKENPPITVRLTRLEDFMEKIEKSIARLFWIVVAAVVTFIADVAFHAMHLGK